MSDSDDSSSSDPPIPLHRTRRTSVSAESIDPSKETFTRVVIPKTDQQRKRIEDSIKNNFLFRHLEEEQHRDVVDAMSEKKLEQGETIIKQGAIGDYFYVVEDGQLDIFKSINGQPPIKVAQVGPGGSFGELALMYNAPRAATVTANTPCTLWALDRVTFRRILLDSCSRKRRMYEDFLEEVELLKGLDEYERHKIADALESVTFEPGTTIIQQGDSGDAFYLIESGEARVVKDSQGVEHEMGGLKKGDYFGELALLTNQPRAATVVASGKLKVATMSKAAFTRLLGPLTEILNRHSQSYS